MDILLKNYNNIIKCKKIVQTLDPEYIKHNVINPKNLDLNTISIILISEEAEHFYTNLILISHSSYKNLQIILINDCETCTLDENILCGYNLHIECVTIKNKFWVNNSLNYNIGFKYVKGYKIILQNETSFINWPILVTYINDNLHEELYLMINKKENNDQIPLLTAIKTSTLVKTIKNYDYDFSMGYGWHDKYIIYKMEAQNIKIINLINDDFFIGKINMKSFSTISYEYNKFIFNMKINLNKLNADFDLMFFKEKNDNHLFIDIMNNENEKYKYSLKNKLKIFVLGSNGMLGNYIKKYFEKNNYQVISINRNTYDALNNTFLDLENNRSL